MLDSEKTVEGREPERGDKSHVHIDVNQTINPMHDLRVPSD
jgi:hypothetical protein